MGLLQQLRRPRGHPEAVAPPAGDTARHRRVDGATSIGLWVDRTTPLPTRLGLDPSQPRPDGVRSPGELSSATPPAGYTLDDQPKAK